MSALRGLSTISFWAADMDAAKTWYSEFLGIEPYFERPGYMEFRIGDYQQEFGIIDSKYAPATPGFGTIAYWHVDDLNSTLERLLAMGATTFEEPTERGPGFVTASVTDPFGNILGIMTNAHYLEILNGRADVR